MTPLIIGIIYDQNFQLFANLTKLSRDVNLESRVWVPISPSRSTDRDLKFKICVFFNTYVSRLLSDRNTVLKKSTSDFALKHRGEIVKSNNWEAFAGNHPKIATKVLDEIIFKS